MSVALHTVALVDDEASVRRALARLVGSAGFVAKTFASGTDFLEAMPLADLRCVVLDLHMPDLSGLEVQEQLARIWPEMPVILITGHEDPEAQRRALAARPVAFLNKPVDSTQLLNAINGAR